ncbi:MAG: thioesterase family protein [Acidimicrobiales bacterium]
MPLFAPGIHPAGDGPEDPGGAREVLLAERWNVGRNQNGGVLLATVAGLLAEITGQPHPLAVTGHFLGATTAGAATLEGSVVKPGRTYATAQGSLIQGERERVRALGAFGDLAGRATAGPSYFEAAAPTLPPPDRCDDLFEILTASVGPRALTRSLQNFEIRTAPGGGWGGAAGHEPRLEGWVRFREVTTVTPLMVVALADGFPPSLLGHVEMGWLPTVELTVHLFGAPPADEPWLRARLRTRSVVGGLLDEDGELWDGAGRLVARFRQMAMLIPRNE